MITTIIFDIGQVLANFRWIEYMDDLGFNEDTKKKVGEATVAGPVWSEFDRGAMPLNEIIEACVAIRPEAEKEIRYFFDNMETMVREFDYAEELVLKLKDNGYKIYLLSNYGESNFAYVKRDFKFVPHVDGMVISYQVKHVKPEPEIYKALIDKYSLVPQECVFLDDLKENLEGAKKFGINTIHFKSLEQGLEELRKMGVRCDM